jgi:hypothetical protein
MNTGIVHTVKVMTKKNPPPGFYTSPLFSDEPCTHRACTDNDEYPVFYNEEYSDIAVQHSGLESEDVETHHGLYWQLDGVLEEPKKKSFFARTFKPEYVENFATPLDSIMTILPLINWKIIVRE